MQRVNAGQLLKDLPPHLRRCASSAFSLPNHSYVRARLLLHKLEIATILTSMSQRSLCCFADQIATTVCNVAVVRVCSSRTPLQIGEVSPVLAKGGAWLGHPHSHGQEGGRNTVHREGGVRQAGGRRGGADCLWEIASGYPRPSEARHQDPWTEIGDFYGSRNSMTLTQASGHSRRVVS